MHRTGSIFDWDEMSYEENWLSCLSRKFVIGYHDELYKIPMKDKHGRKRRVTSISRDIRVMILISDECVQTCEDIQIMKLYFLSLLDCTFV